MIPLPLVLEAFDRLYNELLAPGLEARTHQVEAFALLLLDLGFAPGTTATACSSVQLAHMTQWLEVHCEHAVRLFLWSFAHVYVNARAAAAAAARHPVRWANRLERLNISQGSPAWESYVRHLEANDGLRLANLFPRKASYFSGHVAPELLVSPVLTDLYLTLHPFKQRRRTTGRRGAPLLMRSVRVRGSRNFGSQPRSGIAVTLACRELAADQSAVPPATSDAANRGHRVAPSLPSEVRPHQVSD